jgi:hypothetical protein
MSDASILREDCSAVLAARAIFMKTHCAKLTLLLPLAFLATSARFLGEVDAGRPIGGTPYDAYLGPMRQTYARLGGGSPSINDVRSQLRTAYRFRYYFDAAQPYTPQLPTVTESKQQGDCKAKSLWLASKMDTRSARYVIGKASSGSRISHAWLLWSNSGAWIILDPTNTAEMIQADRVAGKRLFPKFSYGVGSAYSHPTYSQYFQD